MIGQQHGDKMKNIVRFLHLQILKQIHHGLF